MSTTFEELADAGTFQETAKNHALKRQSTTSWLPIVLWVTCILAVGAGIVWFLFIRKVDPKMTEAAEILLSVDMEVAHSRDEATEFDVSFYSLKKRIREPEYRDTQAAETVVEVVGVEPQVVDVRERDKHTQELTSNLPVTNMTIPVSDGAVLESAIENSPEVEKLLVVSRDGLVTTDEAPQIDMARNWGGIVLVPDSIALSKAYTTGVRLMRIEAHPLENERLRIWARIQNISGQDLVTEVGCEFRSEQSDLQGARFVPATIPDGASVDVFFDSPKDRVESYTVMVKRVG